MDTVRSNALLLPASRPALETAENAKINVRMRHKVNLSTNALKTSSEGTDLRLRQGVIVRRAVMFTICVTFVITRV